MVNLFCIIPFLNLRSLATEINISNEKNAPKEQIIDNAKKTKKIRQYLEGTEVIKSVYVPGRIVNFVVKPE